MNLIKFEPSHYNELTKWWIKHNHPVLPLNMLSTFGLVAQEEETLICASFIYLIADSNIAQIAWTTTNPDVSIRKRHDGVNDCIKGLMELAKHYNKTNVLCLSNSNGLKKIISRNGLKELYNHSLFYGSVGVL